MGTAKGRLLTEFLKSRRTRISPSDVGLTDIPARRRTKGLRRSDVAHLAGVSAEWYTLFELGRQRALTHHMIERVCRVLNLNEAECTYLKDLTDDKPADQSEKHLHPSIEFAVEHLEDVAFSVYDEWLTRMRSNRIARVLCMERDEADPTPRNLLWSFFALPVVRALMGSQWRQHAIRHVGLFRRSFARDPLNPQAHAIIERLTGIPEFDQAWSSQDVYSFDMYNKDSTTAPYCLHHPVYGRLTFHAVSGELAGWQGGHVRCLTPADEPSADVFRALRQPRPTS